MGRSKPVGPITRPGLAGALALMAAWLWAAPVSGQAGVVLGLSPTDLSLDQPGIVKIHVTGAPESGGYQVEFGWDPSVVAVTAVAPGEFLSRSGPSEFQPRLAGHGRLVLSELLVDTPASGSYPSGEGTLAYVTLAPLGTASSAVLTLSDAVLVDPAGANVPAALTTGGQVTVVAAAPAPEQTAAVEQASALAEQLRDEATGAGGLAGRIELPSVDLPRLGSTAIWLGLLGLALLVCLLSWHLGRRPPETPRY